MPSILSYQRFDLESEQAQNQPENPRIDSIKLATFFYHFQRRQVVCRIEQDSRQGFESDMHYIMSFIYKKEPNLVFEGVSLINKLGYGPQRGLVYDFALNSNAKCFNQLVYLIDNSQDRLYGPKIKAECIDILLGLIIWSSRSPGEQGQTRRDMLRELIVGSKLLSSVCILRLLQSTFPPRPVTNPLAKNMQIETSNMNVDQIKAS